MNFRQRLKNKDGQLRLRLTLLSMAALPLLLAIGAVVWVLGDLAQQFTHSQIEAVRPVVLQARKDELEHFVQAGRKVIAHFCAKGQRDPRAREEGRELLRNMDFGKKSDDNYFFLYELDGTNVMHPRLAVEGKNLWAMKDQAGTFIIQSLIAQARAGGGFVPYSWHRPSTGQTEPKLGYVELVPECGWMIGTGLYMDHLRETDDVIRRNTERQVGNTRDKILLIAFAAMVLVAAFGLAANLNEQRTANVKLRAMAQKVVQSQETERTRVARELHDGVSQSLASVKYIFESSDIHLDRGKAAEASQALKGGIAQIINVMIDVRRISHDLYPTILDDAGLGVALEQLAREFSVRTGVPVVVEVADMPGMQRDAAKAFYRLAQQALGNIETHARARQVRISLQRRTGVLLQIDDDGVGFNVPATTQQRRDGLGLTNMRERIDMLGGDFEVTSRPGRTVVKAYLPPDSLLTT